MKNKIGRMAGHKRIDHEIDHAVPFILFFPTISITSPLPLFILFCPLFVVHSPDIFHYATLIPINVFDLSVILSFLIILSLTVSTSVSLSLSLSLPLSHPLSHTLYARLSNLTILSLYPSSPHLSLPASRL